MVILSVDTGTLQSAYVQYDIEFSEILAFGKVENGALLDLIEELRCDHLALEMFKSYGNILGDSVLQSCVWLGRFIERWQVCTNYRGEFTMIPRKTIVNAICHNPRAKDSNVRQALIDIFNTHPKAALGERIPAIGSSKNKGPLYGISKDVWSALAVALAFKDLRTNEVKESSAIDALLE